MESAYPGSDGLQIGDDDEQYTCLQTLKEASLVDLCGEGLWRFTEQGFRDLLEVGWMVRKLHSALKYRANTDKDDMTHTRS